MSVEFKVNIDAAIADLRAKVNRGIARCTVHLHTACRDAVSKSYPPASTLGNPPALRTGFGKSNVAFDLNPAKLSGRVGVRKNAWYMAWHDQNGRPFLQATYERERAKLALLFRSEAG